MKILGVEFFEFACFERQFVPMRPGMNLLVGRNNAGKTALLRGLSALSALPIRPQPLQVHTDLSGYLRMAVNHGIPFDIVCELDDSERAFFEGLTPDAWRWIREEGVARWKFVYHTEPRNVLFIRCELTIPDPTGGSDHKVAILVDKSGAAASARLLQYPDLSIKRAMSLSLIQFASDDPIQLFNQTASINPPFKTLTNIKLISPHRVVVPRQMLQTSFDLPSDAQNLAPFLMTLHGRDRDKFDGIERFVTKVFPEFKHVNLVPVDNNQLFINLTETATNRRIALENCGTGVEQILTLATFVLTTPEPGVILMDEPHSYLHPTAERELVNFLSEHAGHIYVMSTHSAVLMNSVEPDRLTHVAPPGQGYARVPQSPESSRILFDLGYKNSDAMFNDQLILVEGRSDEKIVPILLVKDGEVDETQVDRTGFPVLEGVGKGSTALQTSILRYEKLFGAIGRGDQPRIYIFDGDRKKDEKAVLLGTKSPITGERISAGFLPRLEIENYLLVPDAIAAAIQEELTLQGAARDVAQEDIKTALDAILQSDDQKMFPQGKNTNADLLAQIKGSRALEKLYERYGLPYHKEKSGMLIAKHISVKNQPALSEITALVRSVYQRH